MKVSQKNYVLLISAIAALGGLLFGFDTAVISGTTPFIKPYFGLDDIGLGWTVSSLLGGCILGVISAGKPSDVFGRKITLMSAAILFALSAFGSALSNHLSVFIGFRVIGGFAVGIASMLSPMYISEISPAARRGRLVSFNQLAIVIGILLAFVSNALLVDSGQNNWRWMLAVMGLPALLFFIFLFFAPESNPFPTRTFPAGANELKTSSNGILKIIGPANAMLVNSRPAFRDKVTILLHFRELEGLPAEVHLASTIPGRSVKKIVEVNAIGKQIGLPVSFVQLKPYEVRFIEVEF